MNCDQHMTNEGAFVRVPAFVDLHVHFREPGFPEKETIASGARAAAAGGYRAVCMMPNTRPVIDSVETLLAVDWLGREANVTGVSVLAAAAMTMGQAGDRLTGLAAMDVAGTRCKTLTGHGVCGVSEDGKTLENPYLMEEICRQAARLGLALMDHAEPEVETIRRDIALAQRTGARIHIQHVSLAESVRLLREAKAAGALVTCETAPHYIALTSEALREMGANAKMNPPLASEDDRLALIEGLRDGTIDCIATDHAPHEAAAKEGPAWQAANGIVGLETAFPVCYTVLVRGGYLTLDDLVCLMAIRPAEIIGLPPPGDLEDPAGSYVLLDLETEYEIDKNTFRSKGRNTPFHGMSVYGRVMQTVIDNRVVYAATMNPATTLRST
ncbi:dihydroorotase [Clostridia bacterium]|nr:dihydroorotase [Clostridia bacterium]